MKKPRKKCALKVNSRSLFNFIKKSKTAIACKELFCKSDILKENHQKALKKITLFFFRTACHPYVTRMYSSLVTNCRTTYSLTKKNVPYILNVATQNLGQFYKNKAGSSMFVDASEFSNSFLTL